MFLARVCLCVHSKHTLARKIIREAEIVLHLMSLRYCTLVEKSTILLM